MNSFQSYYIIFFRKNEIFHRNFLKRWNFPTWRFRRILPLVFTVLHLIYVSGWPPMRRSFVSRYPTDIPIRSSLLPSHGVTILFPAQKSLNNVFESIENRHISLYKRCCCLHPWWSEFECKWVWKFGISQGQSPWLSILNQESLMLN